MKEEPTKDKTKTDNLIDLKSASKILSTVPYNKAFYFFTDIGQSTNKWSVCLADFCNAVRTVDARSVEFHFKRGDFANWIKGTLCDAELAGEVNRVSKAIRGEELRTRLLQIVESRLTKLKKLQASDEPYIGRT